MEVAICYVALLPLDADILKRNSPEISGNCVDVMVSIGTKFLYRVSVLYSFGFMTGNKERDTHRQPNTDA
jgi:hypothetical protein